MREIDQTAGPLTVMSRVRVLSLRLKARPDTAPLAAEVDAARVELKRRFDLWEEVHDAALASSLALVFADEIEDDAIAAVARRAKVLVDGQLRQPTYTRLFSEAASDLTRGVASEEQARLADHLIRTIETNPDYASLKDLLPELREARAGCAPPAPAPPRRAPRGARAGGP